MNKIHPPGLRSLLSLLRLPALAVLTACGQTDGGAATDPDSSPGSSSAAGEESTASGGVEPAEDDFPAEIPALEPDARAIEFPEQVIPAGTEAQTCYFLEPEEADIYLAALKSYQGKFGHHAVLFYTVAPETPGTVRDCTSLADMVTLIPAMSTINFGLEKFPEGMAVRMPKGTQLVVQQHYVNTSDKAIRVRDVLHLQLRKADEVTERAGFFGMANVKFVLENAPDEEREVTFECRAPREMKLLMMGPHMHEWGKRIFADVVRGDDTIEPVIDVDPWQAEYRDEPPVQEFGKENAFLIHEGDRIRTTCVFNNSSGKELTFPSEMCAIYGYYFPAPDENETWTCDGEAE